MKNQNSIINHILTLLNLLDTIEKKKIILFIFFSITQVFLETISIGSLYPLFILIFDKESLPVFIEKTLPFDSNLIFQYDNLFIVMSTIIIFIFLLKNLFLLFLLNWSQTFERSVKLRLKKVLLKEYILKDYIFHLNKETGKLVRNINTSTDTILMSIRNSMNLFTESLLFIFLIVLMAAINLKIVLYCLIIILIPLIIFGPIFKKIVTKWGGFSFEHQGESLKRLLQSLTMIKEIKIFGKENYFINFFFKEEADFQKFQKKLFIIKSLPRLFFEILFVLAILLFINLQLNYLNSINEILPSLAVLSLIILRIFPSLNKIIYSVQKQNHYQKAIDEVSEDLYYSLKDIKLNSDKLKKENISFKFESIELKNINFSYEKKTKKILNNFNLKIDKGANLGIIGVSGSGKSTLIDILLGLLKINSGEILIDGRKIDLNSSEWKNLFGYVPQSINLFNDSLLANLTLENDIDKINFTNLDNAINKSGLQNFIGKLEKKYDTTIGELGNKLSGGERQRIGIARALYKDPQILIFDESLSSLDQATKSIILSEIQKISQFKTIINISHNMEDLKDCNKIIKINPS